MPRKEPIESRFWRHVAVAGADDCWLWMGYRNTNGYGNFTIGERPHLAHRVAWSLKWGRPVPEDRRILHECDVPACVNPLHLWLGTQRDNVADMIAKGRARAGLFFSAKTHCPAGHPYEGANLVIRIRPGGKSARACRECANERNRRRRLNHKQPQKVA